VKIGSRVDFEKVVKILGKCPYDISYIGLYRDDDIYLVFIQTSNVNSKMFPDKIRKICQGFSDDILDVSPYKKVCGVFIKDNGEVFKKWGGERKGNPTIKLCINAVGEEDVSHITPEMMMGILKSYKFLLEIFKENYGEEKFNQYFNEIWSDYRKKCRKEIRDWDKRHSDGKNTLEKSLNLPEITYSSGGEFVYEDDVPEESGEESGEESEDGSNDESEETEGSEEHKDESVDATKELSEESDDEFFGEMVKDYKKYMEDSAESYSYDLDSDSEQNLKKKRDLLYERLSTLSRKHYSGDFIQSFEDMLYQNPHNVNVFCCIDRATFQYFNGKKWVKANKRDYFEKIIVRRIHKANEINKEFDRTELMLKTEGIRVHEILFSLLETPVSSPLRKEIVKDSIILSENRKRDLSLIKETYGRKIRKVRVASNITIRNIYDTWEKLENACS